MNKKFDFNYFRRTFPVWKNKRTMTDRQFLKYIDENMSCEQFELLMAIIVNLTPHTVNICDENGNITKSYPSAGNARVNTEFSERLPIDGVTVKSVTYSATEGLPPATEGTFYIVSMVVAQANPGRVDLLCPNTAPGEVVRDAGGQIVGVKSFARY